MNESDTFQRELSRKTERINQLLSFYLPKEEGEERELFCAMNYSVLAGGKRIRSVILMETCEMFQGTEEMAAPFAAALEMIHTYSLVHDDLPAMDNDRYRRGKLTTHAKYGEAMGILAGDGLLNYAFELMSKTVCTEGTNAARAMHILSVKAGITGMIAGQTVDLLATGKKVDKRLLDYINLKKTSALLSGALMAGAALTGAGEDELSLLEEAGDSVGLAFQIQDDILDVVGEEQKLGKPLHSDEKNHKETYVTLLHIEKAREEVLRLTQKAEDCLRKLPQTSPFLLKLIRYLSLRES